MKKFNDALSKVALELTPLVYFMSTLELKETKDFPTMAVNYNTLYYNPDFCNKLSLMEIGGVIIHEIVHLIFLHPSKLHEIRKAHESPILWEIAIEMVTNSEALKLMKKFGFKLPGKPVSPFKKSNIDSDGYWYDEQYENEDALKIYEDLKKLREKCFNETENGKEKEDNGKGEMKDKWRIMDVLEDKDEHNKIEAVEKAIAAAEKLEKLMGHLPLGLERHVKKLKTNKVPWSRILATFISNVISGSDEYRWEKPNFRHPLADEFILPGLVSNEMGDIVFVIDTSGSMANTQLEQIISELPAIFSYASEVTVITTDAKIQEKVKIRDLLSLFRSLKFKGGGGTDFNDVFNQVKNAECMVFFTDGCATYPDKSPKYPVLWILTKDHQQPPFGKVAYVYDKI